VGLRAISIELYVDDARPYRPLLTRVLGLAERQASPAVIIFEGAATVILHTGAADLAPVHPFKAPLQAGALRGVGTEICLEVEDIEAVFAAVGALPEFRVTEPLAMRPWGLRDFRVVTPDGYYLRVMDSR
jgi:lactoylglutathione lyase